MQSIWADPHARNLWIDQAGHDLNDELTLKAYAKDYRELATFLDVDSVIDLYYRLRHYSLAPESEWRGEYTKIFDGTIDETELPEPMRPWIEDLTDSFMCPACGAQISRDSVPGPRT